VGSSRPLLIGEAPGGRPGEPHAEPLFSQSGRTLASLARMDWHDFLETFERVNLFDDAMPRWNSLAAVTQAELLLPQFSGRHVVLLGQRVSEAFGVRTWAMYQWYSLAGGSVARIPHPSGLNRMLNQPSVRVMMGATLRAAAGYTE
jgi:uracil-DNA glycosylase